MNKILPFVIAVLLLLNTSAVNAQKNSNKKYPSLLWEITGKGLQKPSYLFGTMHVSNKLAFHLSDSFYNAISGADAVALELNPDLWQQQMVTLDQLKKNYTNYVQSQFGDYLNEQSFRLSNYDNELKLALSTEPALVNSLLYRSYKAREDFEEDTFLDLYIFQTGRRLGKRATGVENYFETEKLVMEAYADMANEKNKKVVDRSDDESPGKMAEKVRDAYKRGDLDLLDSLDIAMDQSMAFREKFLYRRNEIQAASIDSILKKSSLFVGVGAAHLPGKRGVIELLRKMGYTMRPVTMTSRDALKKDQIDKLKVPVDFITTTAADGLYKVELPGTLYKMNDDYQQLNRLQYSDMSNGCFYQVTRVKTHTAFLNQQPSAVKKTIDSLLYENIPGKIIQKKNISKSGYTGYDIVNKTRRGDLQRYNIFITPFEVLIFKMSGKENYIEGKEGVRFFNSINLQPAPTKPVTFTPEQGGFSMQLPHAPDVYLNTNTNDGINRWEYEAVDSITGNSYLVMKKSVHNLKFLDEDSFEVKLMEQSFHAPDFFERQLQRKFSTYQGYPCLEVTEKMKDSSVVNARLIIQGPHYYFVAAKSKTSMADDRFFKSFNLVPFKYKPAKNFTDTFLRFSVTTNAEPDLEKDYRATIEKVSADMEKGNKNKNSNSYWPKNKNASFVNELTGETVGVNVQRYPMYFYAKDTAKFWNKEMHDRYNKSDLVLSKKEPIRENGIITGYNYELQDTGSSKIIKRMLLLNGDCMYSVFAVTDSIQKKHPFTDSFFANFRPLKLENSRNIFTNCMDVFFKDLFSTDSTTRATARQYISNLHFTEQDVPAIANAIGKLQRTDKNYIETKNKLIAELGYIEDSTTAVVVKTLQQLYTNAADTSSLQNEVVEALARHKTKQSYALLKELMLQDPPVYDNSYNYDNLFELISDSLELSKTLLPEILRLTPLEDYKKPVIDLLVSLTDSGLIKPAAYKDYFSQLYLDAKIILKKQQGKDEKKLEADKNKTDDDEEVYSNNDASVYKDDVENYAILLAPFYKENNAVPPFFNKLLLAENKDIVTSTTLQLLKNNIPVADSILTKLAANDEHRAKLYRGLEKINHLEKFPAAYKTQLQFAKSLLINEAASDDKIDSVVFVDTARTITINEKGLVYFFKYKLKKTDSWKMGISGLQPADGKSISTKNALTILTNKKLSVDKPVTGQFQEQLQKLLFNQHKSAARYYQDDESGYRYRNFNMPDGE